jgi:hypothetical protein
VTPTHKRPRRVCARAHPATATARGSGRGPAPPQVAASIGLVWARVIPGRRPAGESQRPHWQRPAGRKRPAFQVEAGLLSAPFTVQRDVALSKVPRPMARAQDSDACDIAITIMLALTVVLAKVDLGVHGCVFTKPEW